VLSGLGDCGEFYLFIYFRSLFEKGIEFVMLIL
jgi:hypothetical protein